MDPLYKGVERKDPPVRDLYRIASLVDNCLALPVKGEPLRNVFQPVFQRVSPCLDAEAGECVVGIVEMDVLRFL